MFQIAIVPEISLDFLKFCFHGSVTGEFNL